MKILIGLLVCATFVYYVTADGHFLIAGAKLVRHNSPYEVAITAQGYEGLLPLIQLTLRGGRDGSRLFSQSESVVLANNEMKKVTFQLQNQTADSYVLEAKTLNGSYFQRSVQLHRSIERCSVFVQIDKNTFKPSDLVQFRVLVLDQDTKPFAATNVDVFITDGEGNRLKQFLDVSLDHGVFANELELSDSPVLGKWHINVKVDGEKEVSKSFEVAKYVLPKFEVSVSSDPFLTFKDDTLKVAVNAKYTYGKNVKGNATFVAKNLNSRISHPEVTKTVAINGKATAEFDLRRDFKIGRDEQNTQNIQIEVKVLEQLTGITQSGKATTSVYKVSENVEISLNKNTFIAGLPFSFEIHGKHQDGTPINDEHNEVRVTITHWEKPLNRYCDDEPYSKIRAQKFRHGVARFQFKETKNKEHLKIKVEYLQLSSEKVVAKQKSASGHFIQAQVTDKKFSSKEKVHVKVEATEAINELTYHIVARGKIVETKMLSFAQNKTHSFEFDATFAMFPQAHLIVSYFRSDDESVYDEIVLSFANELPNSINLELSRSEAKPDAELNITVMTSVDSFVGLLGIDQSALLLGSGNDIRPADVFQELRKFSKVSQKNTNRFSILEYADDEYVDINDSEFMHKFDFEDSNSFFITNKVIAKLATIRDPIDSNNNQQCKRKTLFGSTTICCPFTNHYDYDNGYDDRMYRPTSGLISGSNRARRPIAGGLMFGGERHASEQISLRSGYVEEEDDYENLIDERMGSDNEDYIPISYISNQPKPSNTEAPPPAFEIRRSFPETWFFEDFVMSASDNGTKVLTKKIPSTITSWVITGFSINPTQGLGITKEASKLKVFQPFFVSTNLPYSIKRGEVIAIPLTVFNYLNQQLNVTVSLHNEHGEFEFVEVESKNAQKSKSANDELRQKQVSVESNEGASVSFMIRPLKVGSITIKALATSSVAGDGVERLLLVEPEGVTKYVNKVIVVDLKQADSMTAIEEIEIPSNAVPDSTKIEVSAVGDVMGPSIENLEKLIKLPYGCGEQNMLNFVPNIVVLNYLSTLDKLEESTKERLIRYLENGYQRELLFRHNDGSFSAFGKSDQSGSTWLTAFVAKSFWDAANFITIEPSIIKQALDFLKKTQIGNGQFPEVGKIIHKQMQGGSSSGIALTAYTLIAFLENSQHAEEYKNVTDKALKYIIANIDSLQDNYSLAIAAYALQLAGHSMKNDLLTKLKSKAELKSGEMFWRKENSTQSNEPKSIDIEMTAYALRAFIEAGEIADAVNIMKWLLKQRNENGGFIGTQDTVVGLQALAVLAAKVHVPNASFNVNVNSMNFEINPRNALLLQQEQVDSSTRHFEVSASGRGFGLLQISYKYNVIATPAQPHFTLTPTVHASSNKDYLQLQVCAKFHAPAESSSMESNMAILEIAFPSGFTLDPDHLQDLENSNSVKKVETLKKETLVVMYYDSINSLGRCPTLKAYRTNKVANQKPAEVTVYDYYDNTYRVTEFYNPPGMTLCDLCQGDECSDCETGEIDIVLPS